MVDHTAGQLAFRARLLTLAVATTGSTSLSATAAGYARSAGSFLTDGFAVGMELTASGFSTGANNGVAVVTSVSALALGIAGGRTVESAGAGKTLAVGLPALRAFDNTKFTPVIGRPWVTESWVPGTQALRSLQAAGGVVAETGLYVVTLYGLEDAGLSALTALAQGILGLFKPGDAVTVGANVVRVRGDVAPTRGPIRAGPSGWSTVTITIPWRVLSSN